MGDATENGATDNTNPCGDEDAEEKPIHQKMNLERRKSMKEIAYTKLFGSDYNPTEATYMLLAACLISLNTGFINGVTLSEFLIEPIRNDDKSLRINPQTEMVSGFAGFYTKTAIEMVEGTDWSRYFYFLCMILSYSFGNFLAALISPHAQPYVMEPRYGPTFILGGIMLTASSVVAMTGGPSRFVFYFATAAIGVQNGVASIYSANLIRVTLTGATTDVAIVIAQCMCGNYKSLARGCILGIMIFCFWIGGILSVYISKWLKNFSLLVSAALFFSVGLVLLFYLVMEVGVSFYDAVFGTWKWKNVLKKLHTGDGALTEDKLMEIFDSIDQQGDGNGEIDADELRDGLKSAKVQMTDYEIRTLFRAADDDGDGVISRQEWEDLAKKVL